MGNIPTDDSPRREVRKAKFYTTPNLNKTNPLKLDSITRDWVRKFIEGEEKHGWKLESKPFVHKIEAVPEKNLGPSRVRDYGGLWHPYMVEKHFIISAEHPFARQDKDLYMIWAPMVKKWEPIVLDIPDEVVEKGLPKGWAAV